MEVLKEAGIGALSALEEGHLQQINLLSRKELTEGEVYTFTVRLCDNEVDRDNERFSLSALQQLQQQFVGKSGLFDHNWSARGQAARIYQTELVTEPGVLTKAGDQLVYLKGYAYMIPTEANRDLIAEIEGGIKKEVSVGCAVASSTCSICGQPIHSEELCHHVKGRSYEGQLCWGELSDVTDVYEWSFVAVPAQPGAGVLHKSFRDEGAWKALEVEASLGRRYLAGLRQEVVRLGGMAEPELPLSVLHCMTEKLGEEELLALQKHYQLGVERRFPVGVQLSYHGEEATPDLADRAFLI